MAPPLIKVRGAARAKGIPQGYVLGRVSAGNGDVQLLKIGDLKQLGVQSRNDPALLANIPAETILANPGPGVGQPVPLNLSDILDFLSTNQGDIIYRNATDWVVLSPGSPGEVLTTGGPAADPSWGAGGGGGGGGVVYDDGTVPAGNIVANTTSETFIKSEYTFTVLFDPLLLNDVVRVTLRGTYGTDASVAPNLTVKFYLNGTVLGSTGAVTLTTGKTNAGWEAELLFFVTQAGGSATLESQGSAQLNGWQAMVNTAAVSSNTTVDQRLRASLTWSVADADDTVTVRQMLVEHMAGANAPPPAVTQRQFIMPGDFEGVFMDVTSATKSFIVPIIFVNEK